MFKLHILHPNLQKKNFKIVFKMSISDLQESRLSRVRACLSDVRACLSDVWPCLSDVRACLGDVRACLSDVRACLSDVRARLSHVRARLSHVRARLSGVRARLSGVRKNIKTLITLLFLSFERREINLCHNHIFRIRICKTRFKMETLLLDSFQDKFHF